MDKDGVRVTVNFRPNAFNYLHNIRDKDFCKKEKHIDLSEFSEILVDKGDLESAFNSLFEFSVKEYNKEQRRKDRRIDNYFEDIKKNERKGKHKNLKSDSNIKPVYEIELKIGNQQNQYDNREILYVVLKNFVKELEKLYGKNMVIIGAYLHDDEFTIIKGKKIFNPPHIHLDVVFVGHSLTTEEKKIEDADRDVFKEEKKKQLKETNIEWNEKLWKKTDWTSYRVNKFGKALRNGMPLNCSMSAALAEIGYRTEAKKGTAQMQFERKLQMMFQDFVEGYGIKVNRTKVEAHSHMTKEKYAELKDAERTIEDAKIQKAEIQKSKEENLKIQKDNETQKAKNKSDSAANDKKEKELKEKEKSLAVERKDLENQRESLQVQNKELDEKIKRIDSSKEFMENAKKLVSELKSDSIEISNLKKEGERIYKETGKISSVFDVFHRGFTNLIVGIKTEFDRYKRFLRPLLKFGPKDFIKLAHHMENNGCATLEEYNDKKERNELDWQKTSEIINTEKSTKRTIGRS